MNRPPIHIKEIEFQKTNVKIKYFFDDDPEYIVVILRMIDIKNDSYEKDLDHKYIATYLKEKYSEMFV